jgi:hypothetical protein
MWTASSKYMLIIASIEQCLSTWLVLILSSYFAQLLHWKEGISAIMGAQWNCCYKYANFFVWWSGEWRTEILQISTRCPPTNLPTLKTSSTWWSLCRSFQDCSCIGLIWSQASRIFVQLAAMASNFLRVSFLPSVFLIAHFMQYLLNYVLSRLWS